MSHTIMSACIISVIVRLSMHGGQAPRPILAFSRLHTSIRGCSGVRQLVLSRMKSEAIGSPTYASCFSKVRGRNWSMHGRGGRTLLMWPRRSRGTSSSDIWRVLWRGSQRFANGKLRWIGGRSSRRRPESG